MLARMKERIGMLVKDDDGHVLVEYGVILVVIAIACITIVAEIGHKTGNLMDKSASSYPD